MIDVCFFKSFRVSVLFLVRKYFFVESLVYRFSIRIVRLKMKNGVVWRCRIFLFWCGRGEGGTFFGSRLFLN